MTALDFKEISQKCLNETDKIITDFGPRLAGSDSCKKTANYIYNTLSEYCDEVHKEEFIIHPASFSFYIKFLPIMFVLGSLLFFLHSQLVIIPLIGLLLGLFMMIIIFGTYKHIFDPLFPKKKGINVWGQIEPTGEVKQQILLSGHHDSAREIRILASPFQKFYALAILIPYFFFLYAIIIFLIDLLGSKDLQTSPILIMGFILSFPFIGIYYFMLSSKGTPGAGDNLIASVLVSELAKYLHHDKNNPVNFLKHTRIIFASFDAEEAGLRGAASFMNTHQGYLHQFPTFHLNFDSLYNFNEFHILTKDINGFISLSLDMVEDMIKIGKNHGIELQKLQMPFGGGATDAAESARIGIPATTILAMPTNIVREGMVYHTRNDTVKYIEPKVVEECLRMAWDYLLYKDNQLES